MVDFQSRETRRGVGNDERDEPDDDEAVAEERTGSTTERDDSATPDRSGIVLLKVSDSEASGESADDTVVDVLEANDWRIIDREHVPATYDAVQSAVDRVLGRRNVEAVVTVGGTGVTPSDVTVEATEPLLEKQLPGFGELFRISYHERVGTAVVGMRPMAGMSDGVPVFCLPGDRASAQFAASEILVDSLTAIVDETAE